MSRRKNTKIGNMTTNREFRLGSAEWPVTVPAEKSDPLNQSTSESPTASAKELVVKALESPFGFESMRRAMTPDDRVAIVIDDQLPRLAEQLPDAAIQPLS